MVRLVVNRQSFDICRTAQPCISRHILAGKSSRSTVVRQMSNDTAVVLQVEFTSEVNTAWPSPQLPAHLHDSGIAARCVFDSRIPANRPATVRPYLASVLASVGMPGFARNARPKPTPIPRPPSTRPWIQSPHHVRVDLLLRHFPQGSPRLQTIAAKRSRSG